MKYLSVALVLLFSCQNSQDKFVNAEFDKIKGAWHVEQVLLPNNAPDSIKNYIKSGVFDFGSGCKYNAKNFAKSNQSCAGDVELNQRVLTFFYLYSYEKKLFRWNLGLPAIPITDKNRQSDQRDIDVYNRSIAIFDGEWDVVINADKLVATRKSVERPFTTPPNFYSSPISFTATRK